MHSCMWDMCREIADRLGREVMFLQFAGTDTTSYSMTRAAVWLARYPEWHDALWAEQQRLMAEYGDVIDRRVRTSAPLPACMFTFSCTCTCTQREPRQ
jgi:cytochrome P450